MEFEYDRHDRVTGKKVSSQSGQTPVKTVAYAYNANGQLARVEDILNGFTTTYAYDLSGRVTEYANGQGSISYGYDNLDRTGKITMDFGGKRLTTGYSYLSANRPGVTTLPEGKVDRTYDSLQRETVHQVYPDAASGKHLRSESTFLNLGGNRTTERVAGYDQYVGTSDSDKKAVPGYHSFDYTYDKNGNITKILEKDGEKSRTERRIYLA